MKNLATTNKKDFTILTNGEAFISQTAIAKLCGVGQNAISQFIKKTGDTLNLNKLNQLDAKSLELVIGYYAFESQRPSKIAQQNYRLLAQAGAKAFIYTQAGYQFNAVSREDLLQHTREAQRTWSDALKEVRLIEGKDTKSFHYSNENLMLNKIVLGERRSFSEDEMSERDIELLEEARTLNGALIKVNIIYKERKVRLQDWFNKLPLRGIH